MRNGKHYVSVRLTKDEKEYFLNISKACGIPERTLLYWLVNDMPVSEKPPEIFFKLCNLFIHTQVNVGICERNLSERIKSKYSLCAKKISEYNWKILRKAMFY